MDLQELGHAIRQARMARAITQAGLAQAAGLSRDMLYKLENGLANDLGIRKILALLDQLDLTLGLQPKLRIHRRSFLKMACVTASVSLKTQLTEDELTRALLTGKSSPDRHAHLQILLDEAPASLLRGLVEQASQWTAPGKLERNLRRLAREVQASRPIEQWLKTG